MENFEKAGNGHKYNRNECKMRKVKFHCSPCLRDGNCVGAKIKNGLIIIDFIYIPSLVNKNKEIQRTVNLHFDRAKLKKKEKKALQIIP